MKAKELCEYHRICSVYKGEAEGLTSPLHIIRNVFCNRGLNGWNNCARYTRYREGDDVPALLMPFEK